MISFVSTAFQQMLNIFLGLVVCSQDDDLLGEILDEVAKKKTSDLSDNLENKKKLDGKIILIF